MAASGDLGAQAVITGGIRLGFVLQGQGLRGIESWAINGFAVDQPVLTMFSTWVLVGTPPSSASSTAVNTACSS